MRKVRKKFLSFGIAAALTVQTVMPGGMILHASEKTAGLTGVASNVRITGVQNGQTTLDMELYARYDSEAVSADGGSLEIVEYNSVNGFAYAVSGIKGTLIAVKVDGPTDSADAAKLNGTEYDVKALVEKTVLGDAEFKYGDMTSVAVSPDGSKIAVAVQHEAYDKAGAIVIFNCSSDGSISNPQVYAAGVQPDMVTFADNNTVLSADEGEPRNGYGEGAVDPAGSVTVLNLESGASSQVGFGSFTAEDLIAENVLIGAVDGKTIAPATDLEPEYISVSEDGSKAYVALQEANAVAVLDIGNKTFTGVYSVGFEDYSSVKVDIQADGGYNPSVYENLVGARMPDGIATYEKCGETYLVTANEGDSREWADYSNETTTQAFTGADVTVLDAAKCMGIPEGKTAMFGGRGFTIFQVTDSGLREVYDSGADFESIMAEAFPANFNCSNNNTTVDARSTSKGPEPENVTIGQIDGRIYAFVAVERIGGIMAYDVTNPEYSMNVNYCNSRDFSSAIGGDVAPEGICTAVVDGKPVVMAAGEVSGTLAVYALTKQEADDIIVLYTNDVHNAYEKSADCLGYASVAQYKKQLESLGYQVELVDNGDAIQGEIVGTLSKGSYLKDIMKQTGYSFAIPGNHEFDFGMDQFLQIAKEAEADNGYQYLSCNFINLKTNKTVFSPYEIVEQDGKKVAYIGVSTPESFTKSTPTYFQDGDGNYIYGFCEGNDGKDLYAKVQETIDDAKSAGADYIVVLSHLGIDPSSEPWTSKELIANTTGIDALLDGHSHSTISSEVCKDRNNKNVVLTSTGTKLKDLGVLRIATDGSVSSKLVNSISMQDSATLSYVNDITAKFKDLQNSVVAKSEVTLTTNDPVTGNRLVRSQETNLGDLCADAYRKLLGADIAFVNGGGVRANINQGDITYGDIIKVHPFGNKACLVEATGQEILDALEMGSRIVLEGENGGFLQVSGLTYDIDTTIPSSVVLDNKKMFVSVNGAYRVKNVKVAGKALDLNKTYTLASHNYMLKSSGDGYSMFAGNKILRDEVKVDNQVLIEYITNTLGGNIKADSIYTNPYGEKRIRVITESKEPTKDSDGYIKYLQGSSVVTEVIKAEGSTSEAGTVTQKPATDNNNTVDKEEKHIYKQTVIPATMKKDGKITEKCTVCGDTKTTVIPKISNITLSTTTYTYNKKVRKPAITVIDSTGNLLTAGTDYTVSYEGGRKNVGIYTAAVTLLGNYQGTVTKSFTIVPKGTSISKLSSGSKSLTVTWKKQKSQTTGYQIQYSTSSRFTEETSSVVNVNKNTVVAKTIRKVQAGRKYYVRVRTYKNVKWNGETRKVYSKWSDTKSKVILK